MPEKKEYPNYSPGLEGVIAGVSSISRVDPEKQVLTLRGYDATELAKKASFEEVAYLLIVGHLPKKKELNDFKARIKVHMHLHRELIDMLGLLPKTKHPMDGLRTGISFLSGSDPDL